MYIGDLVPIKTYKLRKENDPWVGPVIDYVIMHIHRKTGEFYGRPVTDAGGWIQGTRPTRWYGKHNVYNFSHHEDNRASLMTKEMEFVKFKLEKITGAVVFVECDHLGETPLVFYDSEWAEQHEKIYEIKFERDK